MVIAKLLDCLHNTNNRFKNPISFIPPNFKFLLIERGYSTIYTSTSERHVTELSIFYIPHHDGAVKFRNFKPHHNFSSFPTLAPIPHLNSYQRLSPIVITDISTCHAIPCMDRLDFLDYDENLAALFSPLLEPVHFNSYKSAPLNSLISLVL